MKVDELEGKKVAMAASGGLDSCVLTRWQTDHGVRVICFIVNLGQPDEPDLQAVSERMLACGAERAFIIDGREMLARAGLFAIQAQARYEGEYWNTTGIARYVTTALINKAMLEMGIDVFVHGATGRGNDQVRFQLVTNMFCPTISVYAPWRDEAFVKPYGGRKEEINFSHERGLPIRHSHDKPYSTDANMIGLTHEAGELESLEVAADFVKPEMGVLPADAPDEPQILAIEFRKGVPRQMNGVNVTLVSAFEVANKIGGQNGIAICRHVVENRFVGVKSRGVYEMPGIELLGKCYEYLLELILDRRARELFECLSRYIGKQIYQGYWLDTGSQAAMQAIFHMARHVTGTISVSLYKGQISFVAARDVTSSLYSEADASMENIGSFNHADSEGFLRVLGVSAKRLATSGQVKEGRHFLL